MITTIDQSKKLEVLGFYQWTLYLYDKYKEKKYNAYDPTLENKNSNDYYKAPTIPQALQWIRDNKGIECGVYPALAAHLENRRIAYEWIMFGNEKENITILRSKITKLYTHPLAESALLDAVLNYLIKKKNE